MKNQINVKLKINNGVVKMGQLIEKCKNVRIFAWGALICITILMPLAFGLAVWIAKH